MLSLSMPRTPKGQKFLRLLSSEHHLDASDSSIGAGLAALGQLGVSVVARDRDPPKAVRLETL